MLKTVRASGQNASGTGTVKPVAFTMRISERRSLPVNAWREKRNTEKEEVADKNRNLR